ncbi:MAG: Ger(x)C family spore germination protein [Clostridia bacterium]|nr:Ger(x)C family spore germination protein [Clostridia bacterium]
MKKIICITLIIIICFTLGGCYDSKEISRIAFIIAVGFDVDSYSFQIVKPSAFEGEGSEDSPLFTTTIKAPNVYIAMDKLNSTISEKCDYSHIKLVLFSKEKLEKGIKNEIDAMLKSNEFHPNTRIAVCEENASDYFNNMEIPLDANPAEYYENIFKKGFTEYSPDTNLKDMQKNYNSQVIANVVPVLSNKSTGMVITREYKSIDFADENEVLLYHILNEKDFQGNYPIDQHTVVSLNKKSCKYHIDLSDDIPMISVKLNLDGNIIWSEDNVDKGNCQNIITEKLESDITEFLYRASMQYKADIFKFYKLAKTNYLTVQSWENENWQKMYEKANYNVTINAKISREGLNIN